MSFANPTALFWAALAIPIVIFYILKIRLRRVPVSTIIFWRQIFEEKQPRSIWQHLKHLLSLLVQLAFLSLLVLALAEPFFRWEILEARRIVLVIDNSASMNATDVSPSRLDAAKRVAYKVIEALRFRDEMAIVSAGTQPQVHCGLTGHQKTLRKALDAVPARDGPTRVKEAVDLARRLLADQKNRTVIVLSDGCFEGAAELAASDLQWLAVGERTGNVGITRFQVRRSLLDPLGYEILAEVANYSDETADCRLELHLDDDVIDVVPLKLESGGEWSQVFEKTSPAGGRLVAKLDRPDTLIADNQAWALLPRRERQPVILVTAGNLFLQKVFEASPLVNLSVVGEPPPQQPPGTVVVFHRTVPQQLPEGSVLVIEPAESSDLWEIGDKLENPIVTKQDKDSPLMAHVKLDNVLMPEARKLTPKAKTHELATSLTADPLYFTLDRTTGKLLVLTVNLDQGDLPLRTAFPIMMTNALGWFAGTKGDLRESLATGAVTEVELVVAAERDLSIAGEQGRGGAGEQGRAGAGETNASAVNGEYVLRAPNGDVRPIPSGVAKAMVGPLDQCGVWSIEMARAKSNGNARSENREAQPAGDLTPQPPNSSTPQPVLEMACNLANRRESDVRSPDDLKSQEPSTAAGVASRPIWFYLIATAWLLAAWEWFLYQRRWIS